MDREDVPIANPSEAASCVGERRGRWCNLFLFSFGAYGDTQLYVWADYLDSALEVAAEWLDDNAPGRLVKLGEDELKEAAEDLGVQWKRDWPDWEDEEFQSVVEQAEADLTMVGGHTQLKHGDYLLSHELGVSDVTGEREYQGVLVRSFEEPDGAEMNVHIDYEAFGPGDDEEMAESGLRIEAHGADVSIEEWTDLVAASGEEYPEGQDWSYQSAVVSLRDLLDPEGKHRNTYSGDTGLSYGEVAILPEEKREEAIIAAAIAYIGYGYGDEDVVGGLWERT